MDFFSTESLIQLLDELLVLPSENEWFEFKEAKRTFSDDDLGKYFSALSNEANLKNKPFSWLIFGISDKRVVVGTEYRSGRASLDATKQLIAQHTNSGLTFHEIYEVNYQDKRVILFQIPRALVGIPTEWKGHYYGRHAESLSALSLEEIERIRRQMTIQDWSAVICQDASIDDLNPIAVEKAKLQYKQKHPKLADEVDEWDTITFLNKAKVFINGQVTRTALILLGNDDASYHLLPYTAKMVWILKDEYNIERDYEHFSIPFLLNTDHLFAKIRNLKYRYMSDQSLFPIEIHQYDSYVIREALHNCIAHQDYTLKGNITVVERQEELIFSNLGRFIPKTVENVISQDAPEEFYRNRFLTEAMVNLNMIDTIGSGIKKMYLTQRKRFFPLPDFNLDTPERVQVKIYGKILDDNYTKTLIHHTDLSLDIIIALDKVQKKKRISKDEATMLKKARLVEGRFPNLFISATIAEMIGDKTTYIKNKGFDAAYYKDLILSLIKQYEFATRKDLNDLLLDKLPNILSPEQKQKKISNLLNQMSKTDHSIENIGSPKFSKWIIKN